MSGTDIACAQGHVCVLRATVLATEVLKNLVLPGVGTFTIVDNARVTERDLGNNFFVTQASIGEPRCREVTRLLLELNDEVSLLSDPSAVRWPVLMSAVPLSGEGKLRGRGSCHQDRGSATCRSTPPTNFSNLCHACQEDPDFFGRFSAVAPRSAPFAVSSRTRALT
eukprot:2275476-Rhodomonas_salina.3